MITKDFRSSAPRWLLAAAFIAGVVGIFARFDDLGAKPFWYDETHSLLTLHAERPRQFVDDVYFSGIATAGGARSLLHRPVRVRPGQLIRFLARHDPQHVPAYFLALQAWTHFTGLSPARARVLGAAFGVIAMFVALWAGRELRNLSVGLVAFIIAALSPLNIAYAQEAREYSLWTAALLATAALFVRAVRSDRWRDWALYAAAATFSLYTQELSFAVIVALVMALSIAEGRVRPRAAAATGAAIALFVPWLLIIATGMHVIDAGTVWLNLRQAPERYLRVILELPAHLLLYLPPGSAPGWVRSFVPPALAAAMAAGVALAFRRMDAAVRTMLVAMFLAVSLPFLAADLLWGGRRALIPRYNFPAFIALQLALACAVGSLSGWRKPVTLAVIGALGLAGVGLYRTSDTWWTKGDKSGSARLSAVINAVENPVVVVPNDYARLLHLVALSNGLRANTVLVPQAGAPAEAPPADGSTWFVLWPTSDLETWAIEQRGRLKDNWERLYQLPAPTHRPEPAN